MNNRTIIFICFFLLTACDGDLKTEFKIAFPPKLAVSATLDGGTGVFNLWISEGNALADFAEPQHPNKEIIRDGEIRLFEDDVLIFSEPGPFDMTIIENNTILGEDGYYLYARRGFIFEKSGISTRHGKVYRLEIEVDGYPRVTSSMTMPVAPVVTASMDTAVQVRMNLKEHGKTNIYAKFQYAFTAVFPDFEASLWPVSVHLTDHDPNVRNYFALKIRRDGHFLGDNRRFWPVDCIGVTDISILQDNPNIEFFEGGMIGMNYADLYMFRPLLMSDITFSGENASLTFFSPVERTTPEPPPWINDPDLLEQYPVERELFHLTTTLSVKHFPVETVKYYHAQLRQNEGVGFYTEPVIIPGNIMNGYGFFSVYNSTNITLLEYDINEYVIIEYPPPKGPRF